MSRWGFEKSSAAMIVIVETPDDAAYTLSHPAMRFPFRCTSFSTTMRWSGRRPLNLRSVLYGNAPQMGYVSVDANAAQLRQMAALHEWACCK
jgi:hypothetical protein